MSPALDEDSISLGIVSRSLTWGALSRYGVKWTLFFWFAKRVEEKENIKTTTTPAWCNASQKCAQWTWQKASQKKGKYKKKISEHNSYDHFIFSPLINQDTLSTQYSCKSIDKITPQSIALCLLTICSSPEVLNISNIQKTNYFGNIYKSVFSSPLFFSWVSIFCII